MKSVKPLPCKICGRKKAGIWLNTGEGGLAPYHLEGRCDVVFQIGTAKNGVSDLDGNLDDELLRQVAAHESVKMFELKLSQGAKPGKGGILPAEKVTEEIAHIRHIKQGVAAISPNRHTDINSNADLIDIIERIRRVTGKPVGFKAVISDAQWLDDLFFEITLHWTISTLHSTIQRRSLTPAAIHLQISRPSPDYI